MNKIVAITTLALRADQFVTFANGEGVQVRADFAGKVVKALNAAGLVERRDFLSTGIGGVAQFRAI